MTAHERLTPDEPTGGCVLASPVLSAVRTLRQAQVHADQYREVGFAPVMRTSTVTWPQHAHAFDCSVVVMSSQRYVSPDLTHFLGRGLPSQEEQYRLLRRILNERRLRARSQEPPGRAAYVLEIHPSARLSRNRAFRGSYVCFCDIPLGDLDLHMRKYSRFGIAFRKEFLLKKGATPVMYVPGLGRPALLPFRLYRRGIVRSNNVAFDEFWRRYQRLRARMEEAGRGGDRELARLLTDVREFLDIHVLSHLKFFDPYLYDEDKHNFYMEREWRVMRQVRFRLVDVARIVLPERFARRFRRDFPRYDGEVVFG